MKIKKLNELNILITRPHPAGAKLCELIESREGHAVHLPAIAFAPPKNIKKLKMIVSQLNKQNYLIFISPQAVHASLPWIQGTWPQFSSHVKLAGIGKGTIHALKQAGYRATIFPKRKWDSEGLLALPVFQSVNKQKITIIRGEKGSLLLEKTLKERGAKILQMIVYRRVLPEIEMKPYQALLKEKILDVIVITSGEGLINLTRMLGKSFHHLLFNIPLIVVSDRIKILAESLGFQTIWIARNASHEVILECLAKKRKILCQMKMNQP